MSIAVIFSGQGSQYAGMGKDLCSNYKTADDTFNEASEIAGVDFKKLCFEGNDEDLSKTLFTQQIVFIMGVASYRAYMEKIGIIPDIFAGNSLGEITALTCANVIEFKDAVKIVNSRATFMQEAADNSYGAMAAIGNVDHKIIDNECRKLSSGDYSVCISNYNSANQVVVSGYKDLVSKLVDNFKNNGAYTKYLKVNGAFHSPYMYPAAYKMQEELKKYRFHDLSHKVISNIDGGLYNSKDELAERLSLQIVKPVQWSNTIAFLEKNGIDCAIELGPGQVLKKMMKSNSSKISSYAFDIKEDIEKLQNEVFNNEKPYERNIVTMCLRSAVSSKNRIRQNEEAYKEAINTYNEMFNMYKVIKKDKRLPTKVEAEKALSMLLLIMNTKGIPVIECRKKLDGIITKSGNRHLFNDCLI
jgi:[acyl-carrier-protein] S-malonyltransferase